MDKLWIFTIYIVASSIFLTVVTLLVLYWINKSKSKNKYYGKN
jgi:hypothetical protein